MYTTFLLFWIMRRASTSDTTSDLLQSINFGSTTAIAPVEFSAEGGIEDEDEVEVDVEVGGAAEHSHHV